MMQIKNSPSVKTQWAIAQMRELEKNELLALSDENQMKSIYDEAEVRRMYAEGRTDKEIAEKFGGTEQQVTKYRYYKKITSINHSEIKQDETEAITPVEQIEDTKVESIIPDTNETPAQQGDKELLIKYDSNTGEGKGIDISGPQGGIRPIIINLGEPVSHGTPENVQALPVEEHNRAHSIDDLDDWLETPMPETVGQRIDVILSQLHPSDSETVRKGFGLLCGRLISEHIGL